MLTGDNSILERAQSTHAYNAIGKAKDEVNLAYNSAMTEYLRLKYDDGATPKTIDELFRQEITNLNTKMQAQNTSTGTTTITYSNKVVTITYKDLQSGKTYTTTATLNDTLGSEKLGTWGAITTGVVTPGGEGPQNPTEFTISLEMTHNNVKPTAGGNVASVNDENIPIPTGFYPVAGTSKNEGFVISSVANDDLNNTKGGDQFVWVPVDQNQQLELKVSAPENITAIKLTDPAGEQISVGTVSGKTFTNANINPTYNGEYKVEVTAGETKTQTLVVRSLYATDTFNDYYTDEKIEGEVFNLWNSRVGSPGDVATVCQRLGLGDNKTMADFKAWVLGTSYTETENYANSVNTYGGFYVGRFEAGVKTKRTTGNASTTVNDIKTASGLPLSQKNKDSYTYITRDQAKGLAEVMNPGKSHLLTNAAWDRTLGWIINRNNKSLTLQDIVVDSKGWGNYSDDTFSGTTGIAKTGEFTQTEVNNIYDLAGNAYEWTTAQSPISGYPCVGRGGLYLSTGSNGPASFRNHYLTTHAFDYSRFPSHTFLVALSTASDKF